MSARCCYCGAPGSPRAPLRCLNVSEPSAGWRYACVFLYFGVWTVCGD